MWIGTCHLLGWLDLNHLRLHYTFAVFELDNKVREVPPLLFGAGIVVPDSFLFALPLLYALCQVTVLTERPLPGGTVDDVGWVPLILLGVPRFILAF